MSTIACELPVAEAAPPVAGPVPPPRPPRTLAESGLNPVILADLALKFLSVRGNAVGFELGHDIGIPFPILEPILVHLKEQKLIEVAGGDLMGPISYRFTLTDAGRNRTREALALCQYIGPAPVTIEQYTEQTRLQAVHGIACTRRSIRRVFDHLVLPDSVIEELGPAVVSGRSVLIYGPPGSGKTAISKALGEYLNHYGGDIWIPHAVLAETTVITVFDPLIHVPVDNPARAPATPTLEGLLRKTDEGHDARWLRIRRPVVVVGGELTLEMLDLRYSPTGNIYQSPLHVKANGGVFLIDDFGRQIVSPRNLLNRWILPLEERKDFLTLATGKKIAVPFEQLILFSTNLEPKHLVDEAFLRRIRHKIAISSPDRATFEQIFQKMCARLGMAYRVEVVDYLYNRYYSQGREPRSSDPRDLLEIVESLCRFREMAVELDEDLIGEAATRFFGEF
jgi:energy-coupling factor transporter ATP-binding protein EcfA2